ncbi:MAG: methionyl-tRNA formyltransferase [Lachnospiraceae bacterium]|nr:methionyl-tRNA formyltransferase [Lachnospiraceae bacterium]
MDVIFMGTPDFAVATLDSLERAGHNIVLVVTQPDKPKGRGKKMTMSPVKEWALEREIPVYQPSKIREAGSVEHILSIPCDVSVVAAFGQILPKEILEHPKYGCVNVHASLLPKYRGAAPIQWSILNGDEVTGVTTMQMGVGLDDGDILQQQIVPIDEEDTGGSLFDRLAVVGGDLLVKTLAALEEGSITPTPQDESKATHVGMIRKDMGKLDFTRSAEELSRYVRGLNPWPGTYTFTEGKTLKFWKAYAIAEEKLDDEAKKAPIASVVWAKDEGIAVRCKDGILVATELQLEGKKRMAVSDYLRGHAMEKGELLGH